MGGNSAQFIVDDGQQFVCSLSLAVLNGVKDARDVVHMLLDRIPIAQISGKANAGFMVQADLAEKKAVRPTVWPRRRIKPKADVPDGRHTLSAR